MGASLQPVAGIGVADRQREEAERQRDHQNVQHGTILGKICLGKICPGKICLGEICLGKICPGEIWANIAPRPIIGLIQDKPLNAGSSVFVPCT
jgi:hypothetical protein